MQCLQDLCHMDDMADLRACVDTIGDVLSNSEFIDCYKPLARMTTMTQFKKLMLAAHSQLSAWEMDRQVGDQVDDVKATLMALRTSLSQVKSDKVQLQDILRILKDAVGGKSKASQLPQTEKSCHFALSQESMTAIDEDRIPFHVNFSQLFCLTCPGLDLIPHQIRVITMQPLQMPHITLCFARKSFQLWRNSWWICL